MPTLPNSVIPTAADYRESGDLRSGGTLRLMFVLHRRNRANRNTKDGLFPDDY
jgi:hypothetical protein